MKNLIILLFQKHFIVNTKNINRKSVRDCLLFFFIENIFNIFNFPIVIVCFKLELLFMYVWLRLFLITVINGYLD